MVVADAASRLRDVTDSALAAISDGADFLAFERI